MWQTEVKANELRQKLLLQNKGNLTMQWSIKQGSSVYLFLSTGLLDVPICSVNDDGALSNPRYSHPQFPLVTPCIYLFL